MGRTINTADLHNVVLQRKKEYGKLADVIDGAIEEMVAATPTTDRTNQDFIDRCRECGKTAITRAENDEILNEAWSLLVNVTEEDGVTTAEANGMLKLMSFFFYKYHGLKKKPEWVENVEARLANPMAKEYKMHPIKDGFPKTNSGRYLVQDTDGRIVIPIPKRATNGDVIEAMFPNCEQKEHMNNGYFEMYFDNDLKNASYMRVSKDWWNAPYKAESEE